MRLSWNDLAGALAVAVITAGAAASQERDMGGVGLSVFDGAFYRGQNATITRDMPSLSGIRLDNRISSLRAAPGEYWEVCEFANYRGQCQVFYNTEDNLRTSGWDNRISSVRRVRDDGGWGGGGGGGNVPRDGLVLYDRPGFGGNRRVVRGAIRDLQLVGFNDDTRSVVLGGQPWELCRDNNFRNCQVVDRDLDSLPFGLAGRVSSVRPFNGGIVPPLPGPGPGGGGGGFFPGGGRLELFDRSNFGGASRAFEAAASSLGTMGGRADSLRLSGSWEVCDQTGFRGRCLILDRSVPDLDTIGMRNRIRSARPRAGGPR